MSAAIPGSVLAFLPSFLLRQQYTLDQTMFWMVLRDNTPTKVPKILPTSCARRSFIRPESSSTSDSSREEREKGTIYFPIVPYIYSLFNFGELTILVLDLDDLSLVIRATSLAHSMRHHQSTALRTLHQVGRAHLPICPAAISSSLRGFILWTDRHGFTPP